MRRGELYRVAHPSGDPKRFRVFVVVSRQGLIDSRHATLICAPVYSAFDGLSTQVPVGIVEGLKHESSVHCDAIASLDRRTLTHFIGTLSGAKLRAVDEALRVAVGLAED